MQLKILYDAFFSPGKELHFVCSSTLTAKCNKSECRIFKELEIRQIYIHLVAGSLLTVEQEAIFLYL